MADLARISALGGAAAELQFDGCTLRELPYVAKLRLQAHRKVLDPLAAQELPFAPNTTCGDGPWILWRAPGDWLAYALDGSAAELASTLGARFTGLGLLSADLSSGLSLFEVRGARALEILLRDCTLDLEGEALLPGGCAQTPIAGLTILLHRFGPDETEPRWRLFVDRSAARHFWSWLVDSAELLLGASPVP